MPALVPTEHQGLVTWLGCVPDRDASLRAESRAALVLTFAGPEGEAHGGLTRPSCSRVAALHPRGTPIRNVRQLTLLSAEDLAEIALAMEMERVAPELLGATVVLSGIADFSCLPPSSRLQGPDGTTLVVDMENHPCHLPAREIEAEVAGRGARFKTAAAGRRGVTAWVEREGTLRLGDALRLSVPVQRGWAP